MELINELPNEIQFNVIKFSRHPVAEIFKNHFKNCVFVETLLSKCAIKRMIRERSKCKSEDEYLGGDRCIVCMGCFHENFYWSKDKKEYIWCGGCHNKTYLNY